MIDLIGAGGYGQSNDFNFTATSDVACRGYIGINKPYYREYLGIFKKG